MKLAFHTEYAVQVLLRLDELLEVVREDPLGLIMAIRERTDSRVAIENLIFDLFVRVILIAYRVRDLALIWKLLRHLLIGVHS